MYKKGTSNKKKSLEAFKYKMVIHFLYMKCKKGSSFLRYMLYNSCAMFINILLIS